MLSRKIICPRAQLGPLSPGPCRQGRNSCSWRLARPGVWPPFAHALVIVRGAQIPSGTTHLAAAGEVFQWEGKGVRRNSTSRQIHPDTLCSPRGICPQITQMNADISCGFARALGCCRGWSGRLRRRSSIGGSCRTRSPAAWLWRGRCSRWGPGSFLFA